MKSLLTLLSLSMLLSAQSQTYMYVEDVLITPESPVATTDEVIIHITGNFSDPGAFMDYHSVTVEGFTVYLEINAAHDGEGHPAVLVPYETDFALGMHTPGEYTVVITGTSVGVFVGDSTKFNFVVEGGGGTDGINELENADIQIYPNPVADFATVNYKNWQKNAQLQLITVDSKLVLSQAIQTETSQIDLTNVENGTYFIQVLDASGAVIRMEQILIVH
jgi:hypothetical protein